MFYILFYYITLVFLIFKQYKIVSTHLLLLHYYYLYYSNTLYRDVSTSTNQGNKKSQIHAWHMFFFMIPYDNYKFIMSIIFPHVCNSVHVSRPWHTLPVMSV